MIPAVRQIPQVDCRCFAFQRVCHSLGKQRKLRVAQVAALILHVHGKSVRLGPRNGQAVPVHQQVVFSFHGQALKRFLHVVQKQIGSHHRLQAAIRAIDRHGAFNAVRACVDILLISVLPPVRWPSAS